MIYFTINIHKTALIKVKTSTNHSLKPETVLIQHCAQLVDTRQSHIPLLKRQMVLQPTHARKSTLIYRTFVMNL